MKSILTMLDEARLKTHLGIKEVESRWDQVEDQLVKRLDALTTEAHTQVKSRLDHARVQAHLAKTEAADTAQDLLANLDNLSLKARELKGKANHEAQGILDRIVKTCNDLKSRLN